MTRNARWLQVLTALSLVAIVGCDEDPATFNDEMLDQAEAVELGGMLVASLTELAEGEVSGISSNTALAPAGQSAVAMEELQLTWEEQESPCSPAGSVAVDGVIDASYDPRTREVEASIEAEFAHDDCAHVGQEATYTLNGNPSIKFTADLHTLGGQPKGEQTVAFEGAVAWEDEGNRDGVCEIDIVGRVSADGRTRTLNGGFCGHSFNVEAES